MQGWYQHVSLVIPYDTFKSVFLASWKSVLVRCWIYHQTTMGDGCSQCVPLYYSCFVMDACESVLNYIAVSMWNLKVAWRNGFAKLGRQTLCEQMNILISVNNAICMIWYSNFAEITSLKYVFSNISFNIDFLYEMLVEHQADLVTGFWVRRVPNLDLQHRQSWVLGSPKELGLW